MKSNPNVYNNLKFMKANISVLDGIIRLMLACAFGIAGGALSTYGSPFAVIGILALPLVVSGLSGYAILYVPFRFYTTEENPYEEAVKSPEKKSEKNTIAARQFAH